MLDQPRLRCRLRIDTELQAAAVVIIGDEVSVGFEVEDPVFGRGVGALDGHVEGTGGVAVEEIVVLGEEGLKKRNKWRSQALVSLRQDILGSLG